MFVSVLASENMDDFLQSKTLANPGVSAFPLQKSTHTNNNALVFNRSATGVDKEDFDKKFSLAKTPEVKTVENCTW
jgi:hypothetical protein